MTLDGGCDLDAMMWMRDDFLDHPALTLTVPEAACRFALDARTCAAMLGALLEMGVLAKTPDGAYVSFFPQFARAGTCSETIAGRIKTPVVLPGIA